MSLRDRVIDFRRVPVANLVPHPKNWRTHPKYQQSALRGLLDEVGFAGAVLARQDADGQLQLIDGHLRREMLSGEDVPVLVTDLTEEESEKVLATFDPIGAMATRNEEELAKLLASVETESAALQKLFEQMGKRPFGSGGDELVEPVKNPGFGVGRLFQLGKHRLLCGDSTSAKDVVRLMGGKRASLMAVDPPYLVDYDAGNHPQSFGKAKIKSKNKNWDAYQDPKSGLEFFTAFLRVALECALTDAPAIYQWHASRRQALVQAAWEANGLLVHQQIIWRKERAILTRCDYMWQHEPCFYGWVEGKRPALKPKSNSTTVWDISQIGHQDGIHPTQKPTEIFAIPIRAHTEPGDIVYEAFSGSGSQIIAAEENDRVCYAMELAPEFVAAAVNRWEQFTGKKAKRG